MASSSSAMARAGVLLTLAGGNQAMEVGLAHAGRLDLRVGHPLPAWLSGRPTVGEEFDVMPCCPVLLAL